MAGRNVPLEIGGYYHIYNRGVARLPTFSSASDYRQAILSLSYYQYSQPPVKLSRYKSLSPDEKSKLLESLSRNDSKLVQIISFVLMPNHFHLLLKQVQDQGISKFVSQFTNSYTRYFNTKYSRPGSLFQGPFKAVCVESEEQLIHLSRYIHLNPYVSSVIKKSELLTYPWSSFPDYLKGNSTLANATPILSHFKSNFDYQTFVLNHSDYARELEVVKHLALDLDR
ncbi:MAG: hypothetical protein UX42_C0004G0006 [Microgenomates group bacterium GW2011_GWC1_46_20]|uniref:Transposase IS200-like domain-containing protein n=1 Tax=Candidatus Amesbacteria bacterium GW2011_GWC2_47_8 TaxID=1618367 RepID=A0A0G1VYX0_9BACT|nr:MAG: hypothetical protein UX42_C0004G0006 [Microgenomates group bacterium GW2011_GWC1_46_20]KKU83328.1 MAG: hypothetical protein UY11_C0022G0002 [Candidatus Amesbacteria bacterium GW2011_GWC2_47_8]